MRVHPVAGAMPSAFCRPLALTLSPWERERGRPILQRNVGPARRASFSSRVHDLRARRSRPTSCLPLPLREGRGEGPSGRRRHAVCVLPSPRPNPLPLGEGTGTANPAAKCGTGAPRRPDSLCRRQPAWAPAVRTARWRGAPTPARKMRQPGSGLASSWPPLLFAVSHEIPRRLRCQGPGHRHLRQPSQHSLQPKTSSPRRPRRNPADSMGLLPSLSAPMTRASTRVATIAIRSLERIYPSEEQPLAIDFSCHHLAALAVATYHQKPVER